MIQFAYLLGESETVWGVLGDPSHLIAELVLMGVVDGLIGALLWPAFKRWVHRHDEQEHPKVDYAAMRVVVESQSNITQRLQALEIKAQSTHTHQEDL